MARKQALPVKCPKSFQLQGSQHEAVLLEEQFTQQLELLTRSADKYRRSASSGKWLSSQKLVFVDTPKGNVWSTHGHVSEGMLFVNPLEALYLLEHGNLIVYNEDHVMSLEEVYAHLKRIGFVVYINKSQSETGIILDVYKHYKNFKKTQPGTPYGHVTVVRPLDPFPDKSQLVAMETSSELLLYAVVDGSGNIAYYNILTASIRQL